MVENFNLDPEFYDLQVDWQKRLEKEKDFFVKLIKERNIKKILDIGCGTARHARMFSDYADKVTAIDPSSEMVDYARKSVVKSANVTLMNGGFENLNTLPLGEFDLVTSLGNTLPILGSRKKVKEALKSVRKKLEEKGVAVFQFLNFEPRVMEKNRFYKPKIIKKSDKIYFFIKYFEYGKLKTKVDFLITAVSKDIAVEDFYLKSSSLCTLRVNLFLKMAKNAGFKKIELISPDGNELFDKKKHISLYALLQKQVF